ncbi:MAG: hypothetical protein FWJ73_04935 [Limnochordales bacterium]
MTALKRRSSSSDEVQRVPVDGQRFQLAVRRVQQRPARRFVHPARLHAHQAVFHDIDTPDPVAAADGVQLLQQRDGIARRPVHRHRVAFLKADLHVLRLVGGLVGRHGPAEHVFRRLLGRILQDAALVADVPEIAVHAVRLVLGHRHRDVAGRGILHGVLARADVPLAPRRDDGQQGVEGLVRQLEAHLVVAFARRAVRHRVGAHLVRDFHLPLRDDRPGHRRAQQILSFVNGARPQDREDVVLHELAPQVFHEHLRSAAPQRLLLDAFQLVALTYVGHVGDHFAAVRFLEPRNDDRRVQAARVRQNHFSKRLRHGDYPTVDGRMCGTARGWRRWKHRRGVDG